MKKLRNLVVSSIAAAAILAVTASSASALEWKGSGAWSGTLTFTKEGGKSPTECTLSNVGLLNLSGLDLEKGFIWEGWKPKCSGGVTAEMYPYFEFEKEVSPGKFQFRYFDSFWEAHNSPWSGKSWWGNETEGGTVTFINGSGSEKSRFVFNKTYVAWAEGFPSEALATGTLTATGTQKIE